MRMAGYEEFATPAGQRAKMTLYDGTVVWLNASSTLKYPNRFSAYDVRKVELDGEAFFEVQHNEKVPFMVSTEKMDIRVLRNQIQCFCL
jgi:transmembrane sensor